MPDCDITNANAAFFRLSDNPQLLLAGPAATTLPARDDLYRAG
jgi:hypothetical protein